MSKDNGGPVFPNEGGHKFLSGDEVRKTLPHPGMTLRDYFAAKVISGICASGPAPSWDNAMLAKEAYKLADAMLAERYK